MTGGMGCFSPNPWVTPTLMDEINSRILKPTIDGMRKSQSPFKGILFTGLMITTDGPKVVSFTIFIVILNFCGTIAARVVRII